MSTKSKITSKPIELTEDQLWELYDRDGERTVNPDVYKDLGVFNFIEGSSFDITSNVNFIKSEIQENFIRMNQLDDFKSERACKKCKKFTVQGAPYQTRAADEAIPMRYTCLKCKHAWTED